MQKKIFYLALIASAYAFFSSPCFGAIESMTYSITAYVLSNGTSTMSSDNCITTLTVGQPSIVAENAPIQSMSYNHYPGFCYMTLSHLSLFSKAYGSRIGDSNYISECDMDKDDYVDGLDLYRFINQL
ncbi:MAG: hypothetical protein ACMUIP_15885 [bacterium]